MKSYSEAAAFLGRKASRPLPGRSTRMERRGDAAIAVRYHDTDIVTFWGDGSLTVNSGGFRTVTTKARINEYTPIRVSQKRGLWYVGHGENIAMFADGMGVNH